MNASITSSTQMQRRRSIGSASDNEDGRRRAIGHDDKSQLIVASALKEVPTNCDDACEGSCFARALFFI